MIRVDTTQTIFERRANAIIDLLQKEYDNSRHDYDVFEWERFRYCNAFISHSVAVDVFNETTYVIAIRSYETIVGFVEYSDYVEVGKYSRTTSKQVTQIYNQMFSDCCDRYYVERK